MGRSKLSQPWKKSNVSNLRRSMRPGWKGKRVEPPMWTPKRKIEGRIGRIDKTFWQDVRAREAGKIRSMEKKDGRGRG
jgi:hypothetical protein